MNQRHLRHLLLAALVGACTSVHALELQDIADAALCDENAAVAITTAITEGPLPKWLYLKNETPYSGAVFGTKRDIKAMGTKFREFHWYSTQVMNVVSLLIDRSRLAAFAKSQNMKPLPGSFLNLHYRMEPDGRVFAISHRLDDNGNLLRKAAIGCFSGYQDENDFVSKRLQAESMLKDISAATRARSQK